ncbi:MAG: RNA 2',3'-cyclic phosphodiesterase [candidate division Zixibacteria bacterium]|nr:RNA 2',3'-cyclic phosphodiesterase [candidate division Zixibacteria bacterium]
MRLFIALPLPKNIEDFLGEIIFVLKQKGGKVKWVAPKNVHLTVKFLGETGEDKIAAIKSVLQGIAEKYPPVLAAINKIGAFPDLKQPRVIWAGLTGDINILEALAGDIEKEMTQLGFPGEDKGFKAHLTLGRIKDNYGLGELAESIKSYQIASATWQFETLVLFNSVLTPQGPIYSRLFEAKLKTE